MPPVDASDLRATARSLFDAAVAAADPALALRRQLAMAPLPRPDVGGRTILLAVGKAAPRMMEEALEHVQGDRAAIVVTQAGNPADLPGVTVFHAGHPVPDAVGLEAGRAVIDLLKTAGGADRVIALISGGGSALLPAPSPGLALRDKAEVNRLLLESGLDIDTMNLIRQQLSQLKGGGLVRLAVPAPVTAYILSDVIGDDLRAVASGPTVGPIGSAADAMETLKAAGIWDRAPDAVRAHLQQANDPGPTPQATNRLIGSNRHSLKAMAAAASAGLQTRMVDHRLIGDVAGAADRILTAGAATPQGPVAMGLLFGGETTVRLRGSGRGGRNQELALRVAMGAEAAGLPEGWVFLSGGTDGRDGPTDAAGGIVDGGTLARLRAAGQDAQALLDNNDSHAALDAAGDLLITGATGTNVADVQVLLIPAASAD
ncbi:DUF4147 domain-containing protein [Sedimentitalea sp. JM2-8]|uniref:DUF4147 domain-containing protein n=1 Tax=Sedimentitalea xiamensis TaxID=3050037 RepID=A0ABT7FL75_9RHOB|nr:DUF4147 domain-containing protein [Sedimentitalea xiamensis]MDK3075808.1 DUF4147 domain-containing protein [Sedimentitalea xiamensis]